MVTYGPMAILYSFSHQSVAGTVICTVVGIGGAALFPLFTSFSGHHSLCHWDFCYLSPVLTSQYQRFKFFSLTSKVYPKQLNLVVMKQRKEKKCNSGGFTKKQMLHKL